MRIKRNARSKAESLLAEANLSLYLGTNVPSSEARLREALDLLSRAKIIEYPSASEVELLADVAFAMERLFRLRGRQSHAMAWIQHAESLYRQAATTGAVDGRIKAALFELANTITLIHGNRFDSGLNAGDLQQVSHALERQTDLLLAQPGAQVALHLEVHQRRA